MENSTTFNRRNEQISGKLRDIQEEITSHLSLLYKLQEHVKHMRCNLKNVTNMEKYLEYFLRVNSTIFTYIHLLTEINCKMEISVSGEIKKWNEICCHSNFVKPYIFDEHFECKMDFFKEMGNITKTDDSSSPTLTEVNSETPLNGNVSVFDSTNDSDQNDTQCFSSILNPLSPTSENMDQEGHNRNSLSVTEKNMTSTLSPRKDTAIRQKSTDHEELNHNLITCDGETENKEITIKEVKITKTSGKKYKGHAQFAVSPSEFYVYFGTEELLLMEKCDNELKSLCDKYQSFKLLYQSVDEITEKKSLAMKELGPYAVYEFEGTFFRVQIKNWNAAHGLVTIFLIDYGEELDANLNNLYPISDSLLKYPAFVTRCHLSNTSLSSGPYKWHEITQKLFKTWLNVNEELNIVIDEDKAEIRGSVPVRIYNSTESEYLNELIMKCQLKLEDQPELAKTSQESDIDSWNPIKEDFESHLNSYEVNIDDPAIAIYGYSGKDHKRVCQLYAETGQCFKDLSCRKEHIRLDSRCYTTDKEEIYARSFHSLKTPEPKEEIYVRITNIVNPVEFHCVAVHFEEPGTEETLTSLEKHMNLRENVSRMKKLVIPPSVGQLVIGKYSVNDFWYRAKVLDVLPEKHYCTLFFVDNGNIESVSFSALREIEPQYLHLPFQAIHCHIDGISQNSEVSDKEVITYLHKICINQCKIVVVSVLPGDKPHLIVKLYDDNGVDIAENLLEKNLVLPKINVILNETEILRPG